jgi:MFS family permease
MTVNTTEEAFRNRNYRYNFIVNLLDGGFFGFGLGFASFVTILPLFISTLTDSYILIGLIPSIHIFGWLVPQLLTAEHVSRQSRYKPMVLWMTVHERLPFLGMALTAWFAPGIGNSLVLSISFVMLIWQGLGGGFTATGWQSMVGKIVPGERLGLFFGFQNGALNLMSSLSAIIAGFILDRLASPLDFSLCFLLAAVSMAISYLFISMTREANTQVEDRFFNRKSFWQGLFLILQQNVNFRWFLLVRMLSHGASMAFAFYIVYAVKHFGMSEFTAGVMTAVLAIVQTVANPMMGWLGDRWSHRLAIGLAGIAATVSALLAWGAPSYTWFYLVFILMGIANSGIWTNATAMLLEFGSQAERPGYIGLANTLVAPAAILAPIIGGWLADHFSFQTTFMSSAILGLILAGVVGFFLRNQPRPVSE